LFRPLLKSEKKEDRGRIALPQKKEGKEKGKRKGKNILYQSS